MPPAIPRRQPAEIQSASPTVLLLQPGDVLLIGNYGGSSDGAQRAIDELRDLFPQVRKVLVFQHDIAVKALRETKADLTKSSTDWLPGDPVYPNVPERGHCSNSACGATWVPADAGTCPECGAPVGPACSDVSNA